MKNSFQTVLKQVENSVKRHQTLILFTILVCIGVGSTIFVEYKYQYEQFKWLGTRAFLVAAAIVQYGVLPNTFRKRFRKLIFGLLILFLGLYILNFVANSVNVYHLDKFKAISDFCDTNARICITISDNFYRFKVYRFVSLTSYFFFYIIFLLVGLLFSEVAHQQTKKIWINLPKFRIKFASVFYLLITFLLFQQLLFCFSFMSKKAVRMFYSLGVPFEQRWESVMGGRYSFGWVDTYSKFVTNTVPDSATVLIPNQTAPWEMEGNSAYIRWFFYPRKTVQMVNTSEIPQEAEYALISYGIFGHKKDVFPNFVIEKEKIDSIILIDRTTLMTTIIRGEGFNPTKYQDKWGIIKLK